MERNVPDAEREVHADNPGGTDHTGERLHCMVCGMDYCTDCVQPNYRCVRFCNGPVVYGESP